MVGLTGAEAKLPGEISGGMRKRAGLARALVLDPEIILFDEPDSGLDPVRTAYLNQLIIDLNQQTDATFLIVTHDINTARTVPDNIGLLYHGHLAMFGPREMLLSSTEPVVRQFLNAQRVGPIGMAEEKDAERAARPRPTPGADLPPLPPIPLPAAARPTGGRAGPSGRPASGAGTTASPRRPGRSPSRPDARRAAPAGGAPMSASGTAALRQSGEFFAFCLDALRGPCRAGRSRCASSSSRPGSSARCRSCRPRWCRSRSARSSRCSSAP